MRLAKYGRIETAAATGISAVAVAAIVILLPPRWWWLVAAALAPAWFVAFFFRDPARKIPAERGALLAPADGFVTDIDTCPENEWLGEEARRISIFLSAFDVHLNRAPCAGVVEKIKYRKGKFLNAMRKSSSRENERNDVCMKMDGGEKILVRQIAGVVARRIVCDCRAGEKVESGRIIGMIKLGSRTEVFIPARLGFKVAVEAGRHVRAGETVLGRFA